ncbi:hypothetical protein [Lysobacter claricitrinus]|uniref:hypothetical protein n=1 Tax=Lysobacter claricitrinus TaxID=3367728 RepID=UPI0037DA9166
MNAPNDTSTQKRDNSNLTDKSGTVGARVDAPSKDANAKDASTVKSGSPATPQTGSASATGKFGASDHSKR